jgi:peptide/nickel transport system ATP-binding protein
MTEATDDPLAPDPAATRPTPANPMAADPPVSDPAGESEDDEIAPSADPFDAQAIIRGRRQWPLPKQAVPGAPLLVVEHLTTRFEMAGGAIKAVDDVSFTLNDGEALGIAGESGCGKTTTALSLVQLLPANGRIGKDSSVKLFGIDLAKKSEDALRRYRWREISIIFQGAMNALNPVRRINEQIAEPIELRLKVAGDEALKRAGELLELVGIPAKRGQAYPHELSGGMRQRAMIAMALACDPAIVIGDEPTTALDVMVQAQILELLERLRRELGLSLILITHDLSVIAETCDRVMVMYAGKVAEEGRVDVIFRTPRHPYTQKLIRSFPNIHADRRTLDVIPGSPPDLRDPPPGCRFHPRCPFAMAVCMTEVPPEVSFADGVRVACHLYPPGSDGVPITKPTKDAIGVTDDETGLGAGVFSDRSEVLEELSNEEPGDPFTMGPSHGLTDDHSLDTFE